MEFRDKQAIYMQIADYFIEHILNETWKGDDKIPSVRALAGELEVNPNTVMRTYTHLQDQGILYNKRGIGFFVADDAKAKVKALKRMDFIKNQLPEFFKTLNLLDFSIDEVANYFTEWKNKTVKNG